MRGCCGQNLCDPTLEPRRERLLKLWPQRRGPRNQKAQGREVELVDDWVPGEKQRNGRDKETDRSLVALDGGAERLDLKLGQDNDGRAMVQRVVNRFSEKAVY